MEWLFIFLGILVLSSFISFGLSYVVYRNRDKEGALPLIGVLLGSGIWTGSDAAILASNDPSTMLRLHAVGFVGSSLLVFSIFLFSLLYTNRGRYLTRRTVAALALPFVVVLILVFTDLSMGHGLVIGDYRVVSAGDFLVIDPTWGPAFTINVLYSYALVVSALLLYVLEFARAEPGNPHRRQLILLALAVGIPSIASAVYITTEPLVDPTGVALAITGILFYALLFRFELLNLVPIARSTAIKELEHGFMVLDTNGRIVDVNKSMAAMSESSRAVLVGSRVEDAYDEHPEFVEMIEDDVETNRDFSVQYDDELRHFNVDVSKVHAANGRFVGWVVLARDVTTDRRRERRLREQTELLRQQNRRLEQFANIVSHDLRNPLTVATGYLELERERHSPSNLEAIDRALDRMDEIIEDVLTISRQTAESIDAEPVDLEPVAGESWAMIDTRDGELRIDSNERILADRSRLRRLLENLFRNAFDHGKDDVTVTVGSMPDGFYVEDDGPGIPAANREQVFEEGYSTAGSGTGFGLAIVSAIADAHGWSVRATESETGGARFEISGIDEVIGDDRAGFD
ncbi:histidine kinase N-terminal 7TM domain-containing protein [Halosolutus gelatinilyticus]|uniref:sensor histidine kinase n=1 Tax=Halosolutus gelatinilyticus TaxID=2931975 RepID=UPI001FF12B61|nr:histidine kinase N-terminal 7TM domain-containing protein [Halosolutus gelatinilyticus]